MEHFLTTQPPTTRPPTPESQICGKPNDGWNSISSSCYCPTGQTKVSKLIGPTKIYKCDIIELPKPTPNVGTLSSNACTVTPPNWPPGHGPAPILDGISTNSSCTCPGSMVQISTPFNNKTYYTCSK